MEQQQASPSISRRRDPERRKASADMISPRRSFVNSIETREGLALSAYTFLNLEIMSLYSSRGEMGKLETLGFLIGGRFTERFVRGMPRFSSALDAIKFLCKNWWVALFGKQIDKLQTNHKGVYVLCDNSFSWMCSAPIDNNDADAVLMSKKTFIMPCGIIRGALGVLGIRSIVRVEFSVLPACTFNVQVLEDSYIPSKIAGQ